MSGATSWALRLFSRSVLKQQKWEAIHRMLGTTQGLRCLDVGADNGVISYLLRRQGGLWASADLDARTVEAIRSLVGGQVVQLNPSTWAQCSTDGPALGVPSEPLDSASPRSGRVLSLSKDEQSESRDGDRSPFADGEFDRVVLVDCVEHVQDDRGFLREMIRITTPGGEIILNVPLRKESWLRRFRLAIGQTDEAHGHLRPGYTVPELAAALGPSSEIVAHRTYSKFFSQAVDTLMTWAIRLVKREPSGGGTKGTVVTGGDLERHGTLFVVYSAVYPFVWLIAQLDRLLWFRSGYMLLAKVRVNPSTSPALAGAARQ